MLENKYLKIIINVLFVICIILLINILYRYFIEKNVYKNTDFITFSIKDVEDYTIAKNCTENYLFMSRYDYNNVGYFLHNENKEKNKKYGKYLDDEIISVQVNDIKKGLGKLYVVYYKINDQTDVISRLVFKVNGDKYQVLYDSIYESFEV